MTTISPKSSPPSDQVPARKSEPSIADLDSLLAAGHLTEEECWKKMDEIDPWEENEFLLENHDPHKVLPEGSGWISGFFPDGFGPDHKDTVVRLYCIQCNQSGDHMDDNCPDMDTPKAVEYRMNFLAKVSLWRTKKSETE